MNSKTLFTKNPAEIRIVTVFLGDSLCMILIKG